VKSLSVHSQHGANRFCVFSQNCLVDGGVRIKANPAGTSNIEEHDVYYGSHFGLFHDLDVHWQLPPTITQQQRWTFGNHSSMLAQRFLLLSRTAAAAAAKTTRGNAVTRRKAVHRFVSSSPASNVHILYASQTGTAQLFAHQLAEGVQEESPDSNVTVQGLNEQSPEQLVSSSSYSCQEQDLYFFLISCAGVGEPPDNGRDFYEWITNTKNANLLQNLRYAVFGLGNQRAHPNHYNAIGKTLDEKLEQLGAQRIQTLGLGDDGDCIDDDFDQWMEQTLQLIGNSNKGTIMEGKSNQATAEEKDSPATAEAAEAPSDVDDDHPVQTNVQRISCPGIATSHDGTRRISAKYPTLSLQPAQKDVVRPDLFDLQGTSQQFYSDATAPLIVRNNRLLTSDAGESGLHEIQVSLDQDNGTTTSRKDKAVSYITGDHLLVYPRNSNAIAQAYADVLDVDPHAIVDCEEDSSYPHPKGTTIMETLVHCIDLGALPSPALARLILGRKHLDYKQEIASPRRTIIDLLHETNTKLSLEDFLYLATPMKPRFYSIASSSMQHPHDVQLAYRPVKYMTSKGYLREGVCTSFLSHKGSIQQGKGGDACTQASCIPALIVHNSNFRLPTNPETPIMMIGGGCGVGPIRAFLQERVFQSRKQSFGPAILYMGYRNPQDEVYKDLVQEAMETGVLTEERVVYSGGCTMPGQGCMLVSELIREEGQKVWNHLESGGHTYLCGGGKFY
jgi:NADPH-ferrihemoprotein reductase